MALSKKKHWRASSFGHRAIPIMKTSDDGSVKLDEETLEEIFHLPTLKDKPVAIVSIAGAFRKGKSFMLNFFLKYLRAKGHQNPQWKGDFSEPLDDGFAWRGGRHACTHGILIWDEVFIVRRGDEKIAVLLMDTQGLFDNETDTATNTMIFALSTLLSSVQIFNLSQQIQENDLGFLQLFTSYAKAGSDYSRQFGSNEPFQTLIFLIRDWQNPDDNAYGSVGGKEYLEDVLGQRPSGSDEINEVRKYLKSSFSDIRCCLLPHPGKKVAANKNFTGCLKDIDEEFIEQLDPFLDNLFLPEKLIEKAINGQRVTSSTILGYVRGFAKAYASGKLPKISNMLESATKAQNLEAQKVCSEMYVEKMNEFLGQFFTEEELLEKKHSLCMSETLGEFSQRTKIGSEKMREEHRGYLRRTIEREYENLKKKNQTRKYEAEKRISGLTESLVELYEDSMEWRAEYKRFLEDKDLDESHRQIFNMVTTELSHRLEELSTMKEQFLKTLQDRIEKIYSRLKIENIKNRRIVEEEQAIERFLQASMEDSLQKYKETMRRTIHFVTLALQAFYTPHPYYNV